VPEAPAHADEARATGLILPSPGGLLRTSKQHGLTWPCCFQHAGAVALNGNTRYGEQTVLAKRGSLEPNLKATNLWAQEPGVADIPIPINTNLNG
jgi:hypothetical protein